jgi:8-oxo-dGTP pyrophosphatase MutT (NUDIX family)
MNRETVPLILFFESIWYTMVYKWATLKRTELENLKIFNVTKYRREHPIWRNEGDFVVLDTPRWANVIPITRDNRIVMVEQYRHGIDEVTLEIPGGMVEIGEDPLTAAERECLEETGYRGDGRAILLGDDFPNPAFMNNTHYCYAWFNCECISKQSLDLNEDIEILEVPVEDVRRLIIDKRIRHSLVLTALMFFYMKYGTDFLKP